MIEAFVASRAVGVAGIIEGTPKVGDAPSAITAFASDTETKPSVSLAIILYDIVEVELDAGMLAEKEYPALTILRLKLPVEFEVYDRSAALTFVSSVMFALMFIATLSAGKAGTWVIFAIIGELDA